MLPPFRRPTPRPRPRRRPPAFRPHPELLEGRCLPSTVNGAAVPEAPPAGAASSTAADPRFVSEVYAALFGRGADPAALAAGTAFLGQGHSRAELVTAVANDPGNEYRADLVDELFEHYLQRPADPQGLADGVRLLAGGGTAEQVAAALAGSPEYYQTRGRGTDDDFLSALFADALDRPIDAATRATLLADLAGAGAGAPAARLRVATEVFNDPGDEYRRLLVQDFYLLYLGRAPDPLAAASVAALHQGARDEAVLADILGDRVAHEFFDRNAPPLAGTVTGTGTADFSIPPDVGPTTRLTGSGVVDPLGAVTADGFVRTPGFIAYGRAGAELTLTNANGTLTLDMIGPLQPGFSPPPSQFFYQVTGGTGAYQGLSGAGTADIQFQPGPPDTGTGTFTLTLRS